MSPSELFFHNVDSFPNHRPKYPSPGGVFPLHLHVDSNYEYLFLISRKLSPRAPSPTLNGTSSLFCWRCPIFPVLSAEARPVTTFSPLARLRGRF